MPSHEILILFTNYSSLESGGRALFDGTPEEVYAQCGFYPGETVQTPKGPARGEDRHNFYIPNEMSVIGLREMEGENDGVKRVWFRPIRQDAATCFKRCKTREDYAAQGFNLIEEEEQGDDEMPMDEGEEVPSPLLTPTKKLRDKDCSRMSWS